MHNFDSDVYAHVYVYGNKALLHTHKHAKPLSLLGMGGPMGVFDGYDTDVW